MKSKNEKHICYFYDKYREIDEAFVKHLSASFRVHPVNIDDYAVVFDGDSFKIKVKGLDLSLFDVVFFRVSKKNYHKILPVVRNLPEGVYCPQGKDFELLSYRLRFYEKLLENGIKTPRLILGENSEVVVSNLRNLSFPVLLRVPSDKSKVMLANSEIEVKSMLDALRVLNQPVYVEEYYPGHAFYSVYIIGGKVVRFAKVNVEGLDYKGIEEEVKKDAEVSLLAFKVSEILSSEFLRVDIVKKRKELLVVDANLCPLREEFFDSLSEVFNEGESEIDIVKEIKRLMK